jgi:hypothetical protein
MGTCSRSSLEIWGCLHRAYLDVEFLVNLHNLPEDVYPLNQICKLPHVSDSLESGRFLRSLNGDLHLLASPLPGGNHVEGDVAMRRGSSSVGALANRICRLVVGCASIAHQGTVGGGNEAKVVVVMVGRRVFRFLADGLSDALVEIKARGSALWIAVIVDTISRDVKSEVLCQIR